jgi:hypothetical protein
MMEISVKDDKKRLREGWSRGILENMPDTEHNPHFTLYASRRRCLAILCACSRKGLMESL